MGMSPATTATRRGHAASRPIRVGIVGCGSVSTAYDVVIQPLRRSGEVEVTYTCDREPDLLLLDGTPRLNRIRRMWPRATFTTDHRELVQSDDVDVVLVLTSMRAHFQVTRDALVAGKHVLVEKPMGTTLEEGAELVRIARDAPGHLVPAPHVVLSPTYYRIWQHIRSGDVGRVLLARARYGGYSGGDVRWFFQKGAGAIFDLGVYNITALTGLIGPARRVTAMAGIAIKMREDRDGPFETEAVDNAHILMDFGDAVYAVVTTGQTMHKYKSPAIELYAEKAAIQLHGDDWAPRGYEIWRPVDEDEEANVPWTQVPETEPRWPWMAGFNHLIECIQAGRRPVITPEHGYHVLEIMIKAQEAGADGHARPIESTFPELDLTSVAPGPTPRAWPTSGR